MGAVPPLIRRVESQLAVVVRRLDQQRRRETRLKGRLEYLASRRRVLAAVQKRECEDQARLRQRLARVRGRSRGERGRLEPSPLEKPWGFVAVCLAWLGFMAGTIWAKWFLLLG